MRASIDEVLNLPAMQPIISKVQSVNPDFYKENMFSIISNLRQVQTEDDDQPRRLCSFTFSGANNINNNAVTEEIAT